MSDHRQSDRFIKGIAKDIKEKDIDIDHGLFNYIYHKLKFQSVSKEDRKHNLYEEEMFKRWCRNKREKTSAFVTPTWNYCCQFISNDNKALTKDNHIKVYIPLDYSHIEDGVNQIFDFLDKNNISHLSRVSETISNTDVIVHLLSEEDLKKLLTFVNKNRYLQEGLIRPNPFAYNEGNIALASDGNISYNQTVANYILLYMKRLMETNSLGEASLKGFYKFVINYYALTFVEERNPERPFVLKKFAKDFSYIDGEELDVDDESIVEDYKYVTKLIIESQAKDFKLDNFVKHYNMVVGKRSRNQEVDFEAVDNTLAKLIEIMIEKGDSNYNTWNIISYIETGDPRCLTSFGNSRNMVVNSSFRDDILYMLKMKKMKANDYVTQFYNKMFVLDEEVKELLKEYLAYGDYKYGREDTREYLDGYVSTLNDAYITNDSGFRSRFRELNMSNKIRLYMKATGRNIDYVIDICRPRRK